MKKICELCGQTISSPGTEQQNRAAHALMKEYYISGMHSAPDNYTLEMFKVYLKCLYGPPEYTIEVKGKTKSVLKSWRNYTTKERGEFIDGLLAEMRQACTPLTKKMEKIIGGME